MKKSLSLKSYQGSPIIFSSFTHPRLGLIWVAVSSAGLVAVDFDNDQETFIHYLQQRYPSQRIEPLPTSPNEPSEPHASILTDAIQQILKYLDGRLRQFALPLDWSNMTPFQERALRFTYTIPYGQTTTYLEIARQLGNSSSARAVGRAEATNPMPLVIPCHRVVGSDGELHGYGGRGGINTKAWLLEMESKSKG